MVTSIVLAAASAALAVQSVPTSQPLEPIGTWTVETTDAMCLVGRKFGAGDRQVTLGFRRIPATNYVRIAIWLAKPSARPVKGNAALTLDQGPSVSAPFSRGSVDLKGLQLIAIDVSREKLSGLDAAKLLRVMAGDFDQRFNLRGIGGAMTALGKCENELLVSWGMDPAVLASIKAQARLKNPYGLFSVDDYPRDALAKHQQGIANIRLLVGVDGRARNCGVVESSGSKSLDEKTCSIYVTRARYEPARTASGEAVPSFVFQKMSWEMPD